MKSIPTNGRSPLLAAVTTTAVLACLGIAAADAAHVVRVVAVQDEIPDGTAGVPFDSFDYSRSYLTDTGTRLFGANLQTTPGFTAWVDMGRERTLLLRAEDPVPGLPGTFWGNGNSVRLLPSIDQDDRTLVAGGFSNGDAGVWMDGPAGGVVVARSGQYLFDWPGLGPIELYPSIDEFNGQVGAFNGGRVYVPGQLFSDQWGAVGYGLFVSDDTGTLIPVGFRIGSDGTPLAGFPNYRYLGPSDHAARPIAPVMSPSGTAVFALDGISQQNSQDQIRIIYRAAGSTATPIRSGVRQSFDILGLTVNEHDAIAYLGTQPDGTDLAIWAESAPGIFRRVIGAGDVPDGAQGTVIDEFLGFSLLENDHVTFSATLVDGRTGIWIAGAAQTWKIALDGDVAPETEDGTVWRGIGHMVPNDRDQVAFAAGLVGPDENNDGFPDPRGNGVFLGDIIHGVELVLRTGDPLEVGPGVFRSVNIINIWGSPFAQCCLQTFTIGTGADGFPTYFNDDGDLLFSVLLAGSPSFALVEASRGLVVNSRFDEDDANPGDGLCDTGAIIVGGEPECTLRAALTESNANPGRDKITFDFPDVEAWYEIHPDGPLPAVTERVTIAGIIDPLGVPLVNLIGDVAGAETNGLVLVNDGNDSVVQNLVIGRFGGHGLLLDGVIDVHVRGCYIGVDATGLAGFGNTGDGIRIHGEGFVASINRIGGEGAGDRNLISGNGGNGITITGTDARSNEIIGNTIGALTTDEGSPSNAENGVLVTKGAVRTLIRGNVVSGNGASGVRVQAEGGFRPEETAIYDNWIGLDGDGMVAVPNAEHGVAIVDARLSHVGSGTDATRSMRNGTDDGTRLNPRHAFARLSGNGNVISGNGQQGVLIEGTSATLNVIAGNIIGLRPGGQVRVANQSDGVRISDAPQNTIGGAVPTPGQGVGNVISGNAGAGVRIVGAHASENHVSGNLIGLGADGETAISNLDGVRIQDAPSNTIGGQGFDRNVITGNERDGVRVHGGHAVGNRITGNVIGLRLSGAASNGQQTGVRVRESATLTTIGGTDPNTGNVISGNADAIRLEHPSSKSHVEGNTIGLDSAGMEVRANARGIIVNANSNVIGGFQPSSGNLIAGNGEFGIVIGDIDTEEARRFNGNSIVGNDVGHFTDGSVVPEGQPTGIWLVGVESNLIGSAQQQGRNNIYASAVGIDVFGGQENLIKGNTIAASPSIGLGSGGVGLRVTGSYHTRIIDGNDVADCFIGVQLLRTTSVFMSRNTVRSNATGLIADQSSTGEVSFNRFEQNARAIEVDHLSYMTVTGNEIDGSTGTSSGLHVTDSVVRATGNQFTADAGDAVYVEGTSDVDFAGNNVFDNAGAGLHVVGTDATVNLTQNWWGSSDGPAGDGPGTGDEVIGVTPTSGWRLAPVSLVAAFERDSLSLYSGGVDTVSVYIRDWTALSGDVSVSILDPGGWVPTPPPTTVPLGGPSGVVVRLPIGVPTRSGSRFGSDLVEVIVTNAAADTARDVLVVTTDATTPVLVGGLHASVGSGVVTLTWRAYAAGFDRFGVERAEAVGGRPSWFQFVADGAAVGDGRWQLVDPAPGVGTFTYRVTGFRSGSAVPVGDVSVTVGVAPGALALLPVTPNPVADHAGIAFSVPAAGRVDIDLFDVGGRRIRSLLSDDMPAGRHERIWDGRNEEGRRVASGVYFVHLNTPLGRKVERLLVLR